MPHRIDRGWVDISGKTRNWVVIAPDGKKVGAVTTKGAAEYIAGQLDIAAESSAVREGKETYDAQ